MAGNNAGMAGSGPAGGFSELATAPGGGAAGTAWRGRHAGSKAPLPKMGADTRAYGGTS